MRKRIFSTVILMILVSASAEAYVFHFNGRTPYAAAIVSGGLGPSAAGQGIFGDSMGSQTSMGTPSPLYNMSGEAGVVFNYPSVNLVTTLEFISPEKQQKMPGTQGSTTLMNVDSYLYAAVAWVGAEFLFLRRDHSHMSFGVYGGYAYVAFQNDVTLTSSGMAVYTGANAPYSEMGATLTPAAKVTLNYEFLFGFGWTLMLQTGYRYLPATNFTYTSNVNSALGSFKNGDTVKDNFGGTRATDLGGGFAGVQLRIYWWE